MKKSNNEIIKRLRKRIKDVPENIYVVTSLYGIGDQNDQETNIASMALDILYRK